MCWLQETAQLWYYPTFMLLPLMIIAGIECFAGYHAWRFLLGVNGAALGFVAGTILCMLLGLPLLILPGAFGGAAAGAALFAGVVPLGSFVLAFGSAASLAVIVIGVAELPLPWHVPLVLGAGVVSAVAILTLDRPAMAVLTSVAGAQQIVSAWRAYHFPKGLIPLPNDLDPSETAAFLTLATAGLLVQWATTRHAGRGHPQPTGRPETGPDTK